MKEKNIEKVARNINIAIENNGTCNSIKDPSYQSIYFEVFFDEVDNNAGMPLNTALFVEKLDSYLKNKESESYEAELEKFNTIWNSWTDFYKELKSKGRIIYKNN